MAVPKRQPLGRGVLAANMARVSLALSGGEGAPSLDQAIGWANEAATSAVEDGDGAGLSSAMAAIVSLQNQLFRGSRSHGL